MLVLDSCSAPEDGVVHELGQLELAHRISEELVAVDDRVGNRNVHEKSHRVHLECLVSVNEGKQVDVKNRYEQTEASHVRVVVACDRELGY